MAGRSVHNNKARRSAAREPMQPDPNAQTTPIERLELREEDLAVQRDVEQVGTVHVRTVVDTEPARLEVDAYSDEVEVEHVPVGQTVSERRAPWHEDDVLVVPVYEEQLVVSRRLVLREQVRIRRVRVERRELFEDTVQRERLIVEDPDRTGAIRERYPTDDAEAHPEEHGNAITDLVRKALQ